MWGERDRRKRKIRWLTLEASFEAWNEDKHLYHKDGYPYICTVHQPGSASNSTQFYGLNNKQEGYSRKRPGYTSADTTLTCWYYPEWAHH